jgi:acyl carrier protein
MQSSIRRTVRDFVVQNFLFGGEPLRDQDSFLEAGIIDSTGALEIVAFLESSFAIKVSDNELVPSNLDSVDRIVTFVEQKLRAQETRLAG